MVPESVRWLIGAGRIEEATYIIANAAKVNERESPAHLFKASMTAPKSHQSTGVKASILDLFRPPKMALRALNMCFQVNESHVTEIGHLI